MKTLDSTTINRTRDRAAALFTLAVVAVCGLCLAARLVPAVAHTTTLLVLVLAITAIAAGLVRHLARVLRWRREDQEDARIAAAWRATHPFPAHARTNTARVDTGPVDAEVA